MLACNLSHAAIFRSDKYRNVWDRVGNAHGAILRKPLATRKHRDIPGVESLSPDKGDTSYCRTLVVLLFPQEIQGVNGNTTASYQIDLPPGRCFHDRLIQKQDLLESSTHSYQTRSTFRSLSATSARSSACCHLPANAC